MSLVFNICVQILFCKHFRDFLMSHQTSKTKQSQRPLRLETLTGKMQRCVSFAQTKKLLNTRRLQVFLLLQSLCKSPIDFAIRRFHAEKSQKFIQLPTFCKVRKKAIQMNNLQMIFLKICQRALIFNIELSFLCADNRCVENFPF